MTIKNDSNFVINTSYEELILRSYNEANKAVCGSEATTEEKVCKTIRLFGAYLRFKNKIHPLDADCIQKMFILPHSMEFIEWMSKNKKEIKFSNMRSIAVVLRRIPKVYWQYSLPAMLIYVK